MKTITKKLKKLKKRGKFKKNEKKMCRKINKIGINHFPCTSLKGNCFW